MTTFGKNHIFCWLLFPTFDDVFATFFFSVEWKSSLVRQRNIIERLDKSHFRIVTTHIIHWFYGPCTIRMLNNIHSLWLHSLSIRTFSFLCLSEFSSSFVDPKEKFEKCNERKILFSFGCLWYFTFRQTVFFQLNFNSIRIGQKLNERKVHPLLVACFACQKWGTFETAWLLDNNRSTNNNKNNEKVKKREKWFCEKQSFMSIRFAYAQNVKNNKQKQRQKTVLNRVIGD